MTAFSNCSDICVLHVCVNNARILLMSFNFKRFPTFFQDYTLKMKIFKVQLTTGRVGLGQILACQAGRSRAEPN